MNHKIEILRDMQAGMSFGKLAKKYGIVKSDAHYIVNSSENEKRKTGPKEKLTKGDKRRIQIVLQMKATENAKCSSNDLIKELDLAVSKSTVCRTLKCLNFNYKDLPSKFCLSKKMKQRRVDALKRYIVDGIKWERVVFSDEKLFTLHGCNSFYSWVKGSQSPQRVRKVLRSSGLMVWAMLMPNGLFSYTIMKGRQKTSDYIRILSSRALKIIELNLGKDFIFQQDNCPIHKSAQAKKFFKDSKVTFRLATI